MQLEENSEDELSKLRERISQLSVENKSLATKLKNNAEQSELTASSKEIHSAKLVAWFVSPHINCVLRIHCSTEKEKLFLRMNLGK